jgi:hypothetical protein
MASKKCKMLGRENTFMPVLIKMEHMQANDIQTAGTFIRA